ncbi:phosphatase PAP2 family protein [Candidatus Micrarchaeota archaeon]|nr:phosphatase PAP2 family protein [Candidatus Micrarchaeota archaeon]
MDSITNFISSLDNSGLTQLSLIIHDNLGFIILIAVLLLFTEKRFEKKNKVFFILVLAFLLATGVKEVMKVDRPCLLVPAKVECPSDYSFPSAHAAVSFALMLAFINKPSYPVYFFFGLIVAFSRIYLGVHTFEDIVGGMVIAPVSYSIIEMLWRKDNNEVHKGRR